MFNFIGILLFFILMALAFLGAGPIGVGIIGVLYIIAVAIKDGSD